MPSRERILDRADGRTRRLLSELGYELRQARNSAGVTQEAVARAVGCSHAHVSRIERGLLPGLSVHLICRLLAVVGLELSVKTYPAGLPIRDVAHAALLERLRVRLGPGLRWRTEVPLRPGDPRALDGLITAPGLAIGVEAEVRLHDLQAVVRRTALKRVDSGLEQMILLVNDSRRNRDVLRAHGSLLAADYPTSQRQALRAIGEGRDPGGSAIIVL